MSRRNCIPCFSTVYYRAMPMLTSEDASDEIVGVVATAGSFCSQSSFSSSSASASFFFFAIGDCGCNISCESSLLLLQLSPIVDVAVPSLLQSLAFSSSPDAFDDILPSVAIPERIGIGIVSVSYRIVVAKRPFCFSISLRLVPIVGRSRLVCYTA